MKKTSVFSIFCLVTMPFVTHATEVSKHLTTVVEPKPIKRVAPKYPRNAAMNKREGWARLSYIIEKDGSVSNIIVNETSGSPDFAKASIKAMKSWQFEPAFENGEPIQQCVNAVRMDFRMGKSSTKGVRRKFRSKYNLANQSLKNKDYSQLEVYLAAMTKMKNRHMSETNYLHMLSADYAKIKDNKEKRLFHLERIALDILSEDVQLSILGSIFDLHLENNEFVAANTTFNRIAKLSSAEPYLDSYKQVIAKIDSFIEGPENLVISGNIKQNKFWHYQLVRNDFSLTQVDGKLTKLDVRCANKRHVYTVEENNTWKIPKSWKNCSIYVYGEDNTQFTLVEHPFNQIAKL